MKELSIEEKERAYDRALAKAKEQAIDGYLYAVAVNDIFSELREESEDEKIRKAVIDAVETLSDSPLKVKMLAWLEKQDEHANFRNKIQIGDKVTRNKDGVLVNLSQLKRIAKKDEKQREQKTVFEMKTPEESLGIDSDTYNKIVDECIYGEQKSSWSEEDESMLQNIFECLKNGWRKLPTDILKYESWLKSLKPQNRWKPSELQLECLDDAIKHYQSNGSRPVVLVELLKDLKKLKEGKL